MAGLEIKLEAERLSGIGNGLLEVARRLSSIAADNPSSPQIVQDLVGIAEDISRSAYGLVAGTEINLKIEAERLSGIGNRLLEVARRLAPIAADNPSSPQIVQDLVGIAEDISRSAYGLVGM